MPACGRAETKLDSRGRESGSKKTAPTVRAVVWSCSIIINRLYRGYIRVLSGYVIGYIGVI